MKFITGQYVKMINAIAALKQNEKGQTLVEYALLLVLIAIVVIAAVTTLGHKADNVYKAVGNSLTTP
jgi:pilus assembly protein Flp/PilA